MKTYNVTLHTGNNNIKFDVTAANQNEAVQVVTSKFSQVAAQSYTIKEVSTINHQVAADLMVPTATLVLVIIAAVFADYRIKKWLKG